MMQIKFLNILGKISVHPTYQSKNAQLYMWDNTSPGSINPLRLPHIDALMSPFLK